MSGSALKPIAALFILLTLVASSLSIPSAESIRFLDAEEQPYSFEGARNSDDYYSTAAGLSGSALHDELYSIIRNHSASTYSQVWDDLRLTDESPSDSAEVTLFYTRRSHSESDTEGDGNPAPDEDSWNREHLWPKSHGGLDPYTTSQSAGTDLHALRPTDKSVNEARGNLDFDDVDTPHDECAGCDYSADAWEPPDEVKGDAARAMFYMDVRYNGYGSEPELILSFDYTGISDDVGYLGKLCTLYQWHFNDPVDSVESTRNELVYSIQNNRNPFIDRPDFVPDIWGLDCDYDHDADGWMNGQDLDDDGDNVPDVDDPFPYDGSAWVDTDSDGEPDYTGGLEFLGDFESGEFLGRWTTSGDEPWVIQSTYTIAGSFSAQSGEISDSQHSRIEVRVDAEDGWGSFDYETSTEQGYDYLVFCIDNADGCERTSGYEMRWSDISSGSYAFWVDAGSHIYTWIYWKDSSEDDNGDRVRIDDVQIPVSAVRMQADPDDDGDGILDVDDLDILDPCIGFDSDGDGLADSLGQLTLTGEECDSSAYVIDVDDDDDGWSDVAEAECNSDALDYFSIPVDSDGDGSCDGVDDDDDGDGYPDAIDDFPLDPSEHSDMDGDGLADSVDPDDDGDGWSDTVESNCGADPNDALVVPTDFDSDLLCDYYDADDDDDSVIDAEDAFPFDPAEWADTDADGIGDNADEDDDGDGVLDVDDALPLDEGDSVDTDGDGIGDNADDDDDGDQVPDAADAFPLDSNESADADSDGVGDNADRCKSTKLNAEIDAEGCSLDANSGIGAAGGFGLLAVVSIGALIGLAAVAMLFITGKGRSNSTQPVPYRHPSGPSPMPAAVPASLQWDASPAIAAQIPTEVQQWTDAQGHTWRKLSDGTTQWWNGTFWQDT